jgi:ArsR family transcriptional regulator
MDMKLAIDALEALAHETRLGVFRLLVKAGPDGLSAGDIANRMGALQNTMSSHLHKLSRADIINNHRDGRHIIYSANFAALSGLIVYLMEDCCGGTAELCEPIAASMKY